MSEEYIKKLRKYLLTKNKEDLVKVLLDFTDYMLNSEMIDLRDDEEIALLKKEHDPDEPEMDWGWIYCLHSGDDYI